MYNNDNTHEMLCQLEAMREPELCLESKELSDIDGQGRERPWREKKMRNELLSAAYESINPSKAARLRDCGRYLTYREYADGHKKLYRMCSCRVRLCPICSWRRSLKTFYNNKKIIDRLNDSKDYQYIFVTLTIKNVEGDSLTHSINELMLALNRLYLRPQFKAAIKGVCRCLEVTHNVNPLSPSYDTYHPHIHMLCAVTKSYFKSRYYMPQKLWKELWRSCCKLEYDPVVYVERCYGTDSKVVAECSKYAAKDTDYIIADDWDLTVETVKVLDEALAHRRLIAYTGCFKEAFKALRLEDAEDGSLIELGDEIDTDCKDYVERTYAWYSGYRQYRSID